MSITTHLRRLALSVAMVTTLTACGDSPAEPKEPPTVTLFASTNTVAAGTPLELSARVVEANGKSSTRKVAWSSSDPSIATVDGSGRVSALESGVATITASVGGASATFDVTAMRAPNPGGPQSTFLAFVSRPNDYIGGGQTARYDVGNGTWSGTISSDGGELRVRYMSSSAWWFTEFAARAGERLKVGTYEGATRWPFQAPSVPGLNFSGSGRGCNTLTGRFVIHDIAYDHEGALHRLHATFRQHCEGREAYLDGEVAILQNPLR